MSDKEIIGLMQELKDQYSKYKFFQDLINGGKNDDIIYDPVGANDKYLSLEDFRNGKYPDTPIDYSQLQF